MIAKLSLTNMLPLRERFTNEEIFIRLNIIRKISIQIHLLYPSKTSQNIIALKQIKNLSFPNNLPTCCGG